MLVIQFVCSPGHNVKNKSFSANSKYLHQGYYNEEHLLLSCVYFQTQIMKMLRRKKWLTRLLQVIASTVLREQALNQTTYMWEEILYTYTFLQNAIF